MNFISHIYKTSKLSTNFISKSVTDLEIKTLQNNQTLKSLFGDILPNIMTLVNTVV